jgi:hypothetical protein
MKRSEKSPRGRATRPHAKRKSAEVEWIGGIVLLPGSVTGEGEPYQPEVLFWIGEDGTVRGHSIGRPGELLASVGESLREAIERPMTRPPTRIRVAQPELEAALRAGHPGVSVICAPTPEMDELLELMAEYLDREGEPEPSYRGSSRTRSPHSSVLQRSSTLRIRLKMAKSHCSRRTSH